MSRWTRLGVKGGIALGAASLAAMMAAHDAAAGEMVPVVNGDTVTVQMTTEQYELLMNLLPRVQQLEQQVQDNSQNLVLQQGQTRASSERLDQVADEIPDQGTLVNSGKRGVTLELSGQIDVGVMYADTGSGPAVGMIAPDAGREVWIVDNDNSSTRSRSCTCRPA
jgi:hypothetical protein